MIPSNSTLMENWYYRWADANSRYQTGKIGMRSYQRSFDVDNVLVRPLSAEELEEMQKPTVLDVDVTSAYNTLMAYYPAEFRRKQL